MVMYILHYVHYDVIYINITNILDEAISEAINEAIEEGFSPIAEALKQSEESELLGGISVTI